MAAASVQDAVSELRRSSTVQAQIAALRHLKNLAIGHREKRQSLIQAGIVEPLAQVLRSSIDVQRKHHERGTNGAAGSHTTGSATQESSVVCFQAVTLVGSLAIGGIAFVAPVIAGGLIPLLFSTITTNRDQPKLLTASLKALLAIADAVNQSSVKNWEQSPWNGDWTSRTAIDAFILILHNDTTTQAASEHVSLTCQIIELTASAEQHGAAPGFDEVLQYLAAQLASYYVHHHPSFRSGRAAHLPEPLPSTLLSHVLGAAHTLISGSRYRVASLLFSRTIFRVLPLEQPLSIRPSKIIQATQHSAYDISSPELCLSLPPIHTRADKAENGFAKAFPALGAAQVGVRASGLTDFPYLPYTIDRAWATPNGWHSAFIPWLIHIMRSSKLLCRVNAARLIVAISKAKYLSASKDRTLALLVVPVLVDLLKNSPVQRGMALHNPLRDNASEAACRAPDVLAALLEEIPTLQRAAVDAGVIKELVTYAKQTFLPFEPPPDLWSANAQSSEMEQDLPASSTMGGSGTSAQIVWLFRCRENGLRLLAALASKEDVYRKKLCDSGMMPCIVDSMSPLKEPSRSKPYPQGRKARLDAGYGNPEPVLLAACKAATAMSRSVSLLRTSLIDAGLAKPVFALVKDPSVEVILASTGVVCNLIMDFSPMRHDIVEAGAITTLCEHAHSADLRIRSVSLWALKHLVHQAPNEVKTLCIEELGTGWLVQIIAGNPISNAPTAGRPSSWSTRNAPSSITGANAKGERVNILHVVEDQPMLDSSSEASPIDNNPATPGSNEGTDPSGSSDDAAANRLRDGMSSVQDENEQYLRTVKGEERNEIAMKSAREELQIQRHALDFIRNITTGPGCNEMIDYLNTSLGFPRLYDIIASKLRPSANPTSLKPHHDPSTSTSTAGPLQHHAFAFHQPAVIITSTIFILSHIAAGPPKHRQQLISRQPLISLVRPLFAHPDQEVRAACLWVALNLMWVDDSSDTAGARARAMELRRNGWDRMIEERLRDECLDVSERARTAWELIEGGGAMGRAEGFNPAAGVGRMAR